MNDSHITIELVTSETQQEKYLQLPWSIYRDDQYWVPPQIDFQRDLLFLNKHPFNDHAVCQSWLAIRQGQVVGRITAIVNQLHLQQNSDETAFFGFFESVNSSEVARRLIDAAANWLGQQGIRRIRGPVNPSIHYEAGLLMRPCEPFFTSTYNHAYYPDLLVSCGLTRCHTMHSYCMPIDILDHLDPKILRTTRQVVERFEIRFRHFAADQFATDLRTYFDLYNKTLSSMWSFTPLPDREIEHEISWLQKIIVPELSVIADVDNTPVGAALGILDYNPILRNNNGQLFKHGDDRFQRDRAKIKQCRMFSAHVLPQYERWGIGPAMMMFILPACLKLGLEFVETSWIESTNLISQKTMLRAGGKARAEYAFYEKLLA